MNSRKFSTDPGCPTGSPRASQKSSRQRYGRSPRWPTTHRQLLSAPCATRTTSFSLPLPDPLVSTYLSPVTATCSSSTIRRIRCGHRPSSWRRSATQALADARTASRGAWRLRRHSPAEGGSGEEEPIQRGKGNEDASTDPNGRDLAASHGLVGKGPTDSERRCRLINGRHARCGRHVPSRCPLWLWISWTPRERRDVGRV